METKTLLWYGVLVILTIAYGIALSGVQSAQRHDLSTHARRMTIASTLVGLWLLAYVTKQFLFGREQFGGTSAQYWQWYVPIFATHMVFAVTTIGLGSYNLFTGWTRLRHGTGMGAMHAGVSRHRRLGRWLVWSFSGTMFTAVLVYLMLFVLFPGTS